MYYFTLHFLDEHLSYQIFVLITVRSVIVAYVANNNRAMSQSVQKEIFLVFLPVYNSVS